MPDDDVQPVGTESTPRPKKGRRWGAWAFFLSVIFVLAGLATPVHGPQEKGRQIQAINCCRYIIISMTSYAKDHGGRFPNGTTANEAFRQLIKDGQLEDERVFSAPRSPYVPDNNLGEAPDYRQALEPGENHWAMTKGLTNKADGNTPLVFENPAVKSWPPLWDTRLQGVAQPGRVWKGNKIIVGCADGSVNIEKLKEGEQLTSLAPVKDGKNLFELAGPHEVLDVER